MQERAEKDELEQVRGRGREDRCSAEAGRVGRPGRVGEPGESNNNTQSDADVSKYRCNKG